MTTFVNLKPGDVISDNGYYLYGHNVPGSTVLVEIGGAFGGGIVALGYLGLDGDFSPYLDSSAASVTLVNNQGTRVDVLSRAGIVFYVSGASAPALAWAVTPVAIKSYM